MLQATGLSIWAMRPKAFAALVKADGTNQVADSLPPPRGCRATVIPLTPYGGGVVSV